MLEAWELEARGKGNTAGAEMARVLREQFGDKPLYGQTGVAVDPPVSWFTREQRHSLAKQGFAVYELTGQSVASLRKGGNRFWSNWHEQYPKFENLTSRLSEVAFNPDPHKFFLPDSNRKTYEQQVEMVTQFSEQLKKEVPSIEAIIGEVPDYAELAFSYYGRRGDLFGRSYAFRYTRTRTSVESNVAAIGCFDPHRGLYVDYWGPSPRYGSIWVAPLVVPTESR